MDEQDHPIQQSPTVADILPLIMAQQDQRRSWRWQLLTAGRQLLVAVTTSAIIVGGLIVGFSGQTAQEREREQGAINATLATACVLALPVDESGRDPDAVKLCFTQYDLHPPTLRNT